MLVNIGAAERANGTLRFRNAGVLFFAKNPRRFFPQAYITCLLARDTDKVHILDRKDFDGGIMADIEDALRFVERNTRTAYRTGLSWTLYNLRSDWGRQGRLAQWTKSSQKVHHAQPAARDCTAAVTLRVAL